MTGGSSNILKNTGKSTSTDASRPKLVTPKPGYPYFPPFRPRYKLKKYDPTVYVREMDDIKGIFWNQCMLGGRITWLESVMKE